MAQTLQLGGMKPRFLCRAVLAAVILRLVEQHQAPILELAQSLARMKLMTPLQEGYRNLEDPLIMIIQQSLCKHHLSKPVDLLLASLLRASQAQAKSLLGNHLSTFQLLANRLMALKFPRHHHQEREAPNRRCRCQERVSHKSQLGALSSMCYRNLHLRRILLPQLCDLYQALALEE